MDMGNSGHRRQAQLQDEHRLNRDKFRKYVSMPSITYAIRVRITVLEVFTDAFSWREIRRHAALQNSIDSQTRAARRENSISFPQLWQARGETGPLTIAITFLSAILAFR
jgi:hypothetical protein